MINLEVLAFVIYFVFIVAVGFYFFSKSRGKGENEYFIGGRATGPWVTAMSAQASDMSGWLLMGLPGSILAFGLGQAWIGIGLALGTAANWIFTAKRLRCYSQAANDAITVPQYLANRFANESGALKIVCAAIFLVFFTVYVASSIVAGTTVFVTVFSGLSETAAMIIYTIVLMLITFFGGYKAVCWTDFFQALMMLIALLAVPIAVLATMNLDTSALDAVYSYTSGGVVTECAFTKSVFAATWQEIVSGLGWGLGYFGMPHILVRFMGMRKASEAKTSAVVGIIWVILSLGAAIYMAYLARMAVGAELVSAGMQKTVFMVLARQIFPPFVAGLLLSAIIAASMSTADSQLLVASSSFTSDIYIGKIKTDATDKEALWSGRIVVLIIALIAFAIASSKGSGAQAIMNMVENAWGGFGSAFGPVIILSLFWKRTTYKGALAGVITGAVVDVFWLICLSGTGIYEIVPGFICGFIACVIGSKRDKAPGAEVNAVIEEAERLMKNA